MAEFNPQILVIRDQEEAEKKLALVECSSMGAKKMAKKARHYCIQLENISSPMALILKQEMLAIGGETAIPAKALTNEVKKGRVILMGTYQQFEELAEKLKPQPFKLSKLGEELL